MHFTTFVNILWRLRYFEGRNDIEIACKSYSVLLFSRETYERRGHLGFLERGFDLEKGLVWLPLPTMAIHHMIFIYGVLFIFFKILVFWVVRGVNIVQTPPPPLDYLPWRGGIWKIKKRGWKCGARAGLLNSGAVTFPIEVFQGLSFLHLEITLPFCKIVSCIWRKNIFFCHHNFMKKCHSKLSKNEPENIP